MSDTRNSQATGGEETTMKHGIKLDDLNRIAANVGIGRFVRKPYGYMQLEHRICVGTNAEGGGVYIEASMATTVAGKQAALALARALAWGWAAITVAVGRSFAIYAQGKLVARLPA